MSPKSDQLSVSARSLCSAILPLLAATHGIAQEPELVSKRISTLALTAPHAAIPRIPFRTFLGLRQLERWPCLVAVRNDPMPVLQSDQIHEYLSHVDRRFEEDDITSEIRENHIWLRCSKADLQRVTGNLSSLCDHLTNPITIEVSVIRHDGKLLPPAIVDAGQARALFEGHKPSWSGEAHTASNMAAYLGQHRMVSYLESHETEVSIDEEMFVPCHEDLFDGVGIIAKPHRTIGSEDLILQVQLAASELVALADYETGLPGEDTLQRPTVRTTSANMSGRIANGGALVFNATAPADRGGNLAIVVRATWTPSNSKLTDEARIVPASGITQGGAARPRFARSDRIAGSTPGEQWQDDGGECEPPIELDQLMEMVRQSVAPDDWDDTANMWEFAGYIVMTAEPEVLKKSAAFLQAVEQDLTQTIAVDYTLGEGRITFPALLERNHSARHGQETIGLKTASAEIAEKAKILEPEVTRLFHGVELSIQPMSAGQDLAAAASSHIRRVTAEPTGYSLPPIEIASRDLTGVIPAGGRSLGTSPFGLQRWRLRRR